MTNQIHQVARAVAYARFSSDMQREESIDAQLRAIHDYADRNDMIIVREYIDRAHSATNDQRPDFQQMIADAKQGAFDFVVVHKLDRFSRNRYDSVFYKHKLKEAGVQVRSVLENLDGSPESVLLESLLEGMNEFYSRNLAREVRKGLKENALQGKHTGGIPPLGYKLNRETQMLEIEPFEAEAVRMIFQLYNLGASYSEIITKLTQGGYVTKRGKTFGKNSLYEILRNEKYTGTYIYNKSVSKNLNGKANRHRFNSEEDIIRVENAIPALISKAEFEMTQIKMNERRLAPGRFSARHIYLLSGKIHCGVCGCLYAGNARKANATHPLYISYRCNHKPSAPTCNNPEIRVDSIEKAVLQLLANNLFDERLLPELQQRYTAFAKAQSTEAGQGLNDLITQSRSVQSAIDNIVTVMAQTGSPALAQRLSELEKQLAGINAQIEERKALQAASCPSLDLMRQAFMTAKKMLESGELQCIRKVVDQYVETVVLYPDRVQIILRINSFRQRFELDRASLP